MREEGGLQARSRQGATVGGAAYAAEKEKSRNAQQRPDGAAHIANLVNLLHGRRKGAGTAHRRLVEKADRLV